MSRFFAALALTALCGLLAAAPRASGVSAEDEQKYRELMTEGYQLLKSNNREDNSRAIARLKAALKLRPDSAEAYYWIALTFSDNSNYRAAAENARNAVTYDSNLAEGYLLLGQSLMYQKEWREALRHLETASRLAPADPLAHYNLGRVYYHGFKEYTSAYSKFDAAWEAGQALRRERPELEPMVQNARLYMGYCEFARGSNWRNAIACFMDVINSQPDNHDAVLRLALCYRRDNQASEAMRILRELLAKIPDSPENRQLLAEVNLQLADICIKESGFRDDVFALAYVNEFLAKNDDRNHPALEAAQEYSRTRLVEGG